jgi:hypothetical protein
MHTMSHGPVSIWHDSGDQQGAVAAGDKAWAGESAAWDYPAPQTDDVLESSLIVTYISAQGNRNGSEPSLACSVQHFGHFSDVELWTMQQVLADDAVAQQSVMAVEGARTGGTGGGANAAGAETTNDAARWPLEVLVSTLDKAQVLTGEDLRLLLGKVREQASSPPAGSRSSSAAAAKAAETVEVMASTIELVVALTLSAPKAALQALAIHVVNEALLCVQSVPTRNNRVLSFCRDLALRLLPTAKNAPVVAVEWFWLLSILARHPCQSQEGADDSSGDFWPRLTEDFLAVATQARNHRTPTIGDTAVLRAVYSLFRHSSGSGNVPELVPVAVQAVAAIVKGACSGPDPALAATKWRSVGLAALAAGYVRTQMRSCRCGVVAVAGGQS